MGIEVSNPIIHHWQQTSAILSPSSCIHLWHFSFWTPIRRSQRGSGTSCSTCSCRCSDIPLGHLAWNWCRWGGCLTTQDGRTQRTTAADALDSISDLRVFFGVLKTGDISKLEDAASICLWPKGVCNMLKMSYVWYWDVHFEGWGTAPEANHGSVECLAGKDWRNLEKGSSYFPRMESMFKFLTSKVHKILVKLETFSKCED